MDTKDRRKEYAWPKTVISDISVIPQKGDYRLDEPVTLNLGFRVVGGLREAFTPDVWTTAWEENDKLVRLTMRTSIFSLGKTLIGKEVASSGKEVRKGKFYWSRNPDLPYRIWAAIISEDGSAPIIPENVEDAKSKMFDVVKEYVIPAATLGKGKHKLAGKVTVSWGRRGFIEKGGAKGTSKGVKLRIE
jgi:hypothetical protein